MRKFYVGKSKREKSNEGSTQLQYNWSETAFYVVGDLE
jgi:hypothetical protein